MSLGLGASRPGVLAELRQSALLRPGALTARCCSPRVARHSAVAVTSNIDRMAKPSGKVTTAARERRGRGRPSREQAPASAARRPSRARGPSDVATDYVSPLIPEMRRALVHALALRNRPLGELRRLASRGYPATPHTQRGAQEAIRLVATMEPTSLYRLREGSWREVDPQGWSEYSDEERARVRARQEAALKRAAEAGTTLEPLPTPQATETVEEALRHLPTTGDPPAPGPPTAEGPSSTTLPAAGASGDALGSAAPAAAGRSRREAAAAAETAASAPSRRRPARREGGPAAKRARSDTSAAEPSPLLGESERRRYSQMRREAIAEAEAHVAPASLAASRAQRARFAQLYPSYLRIDRLLTEAREALETQCAELDQARTRAEGADAAARGEGEEGEEEALTHMRLLRRERALRQALEGAFEAKKGDLELLHATYAALHLLLGRIKAGIKAFSEEEVEEEEEGEG